MAAIDENDEHKGKTELIVAGMNFEQDEQSIRTFFEKHGALTKCKVLWNKGKCFVEYGDHTTARKAL